MELASYPSLFVVQTVQVDNFTLMTTMCPPGYVLADAGLETRKGFLTCECDFNNPDILECIGKSILLEVNLCRGQLILSA